MQVPLCLRCLIASEPLFGVVPSLSPPQASASIAKYLSAGQLPQQRQGKHAQVGFPTGHQCPSYAKRFHGSAHGSVGTIASPT
jgi:hypothetical protein